MNDLLDLEPSDADLDAVEVPEDENVGWEALLEPVVKVTQKESEDFWNEDENVHDDRWDSGIPSWSAWA